MSAQIFISYHRADSGWATRTFRIRMGQDFESAKIFMDIDRGAIPLGANWKQIVTSTVIQCDVVVAVIGKDWHTRLGDEEPVRTEIATALGIGKSVIPVLIDSAAWPPPSPLPEDLKSLVSLHALRLTEGTNFDAEWQQLADAIRETLNKAAAKEQEQRFLAGRRRYQSEAEHRQRWDEQWPQAEQGQRKEKEQQERTREFDDPNPTHRQNRVWRAELVAKARDERKFRVTLPNGEHDIEFVLTKDMIRPQVIKVDGRVVLKAGSALIWQEQLKFRISDGDVEYTAEIDTKPPIAYRKLRSCRLLVAARVLYDAE